MNIFRKRSTLKKIDPNINSASQMDKAHPERLGSFLNPNSSYVNVPQAPSLSPQGNNPTPHLLSFLIKHDYFGVSAPKSNPISKTAVNICDKSIEKIQKKSMKENKKIANDGFDSILILENRDELKFRSKSLVSVVTNNGKEYFNHWTANYCANGQDIEGILVINAGIMTFTATRNTEAPIKIGKKPPKPSKIEKTLGNFEAIINIEDIIGCKIMTFPIPCAKHCHKSDNIHILQLTLCEHGEYSLGENIEETLIEMREKRTPYACVYFNIKPECGNNSNDKESIRALIHIQTKIKAAMDSLNRDKGDFWQKTNLPYFEFLPMNFQPNMADTLRLGRQLIKKNIDAQLARLRGQDQTLDSKMIGPIGGDLLDQAANVPATKKPKKLIIPNTLDESCIVSSRQLGQIISCMPDLYQMFEWKLLYATVQHGTSFNNLMRRANLANPFVIIARDFNDNIFGAYGSASLKFSQNYYGTAETFLFTFKKGQEIQDFQWSKKNDMYIFTNDEGIMFGTGPFYGLWIGSDLTRGRTYSCDTFDNDQLTDSTDFEITRLEVWSIVDPFNKR